MATGDLYDPNAAKKKVPGAPGTPDAMTQGGDLFGAGGPAPPVGQPDATTNTGPVGDPRHVDPRGPGAGGPAPPVGPGAGGPAPPTATTQAPAGAPPDPFAAMGGGEYFADTGQWIPKNNTAALEAARARTGQAAPLAENGGVTGDPRGPGAGGPAPPVGGPGGPPAPPVGPPATVNDAFKKALMDQLSKPIGVSANDPTIKAQTDAFSNAQTRASQRDREAMAGRAAATGQLSDLSSGGGFDQGLSALQQQQGESEAGFAANLTGQELNKQRDELYRYATLAGNQLSGEESRALQEKMHNLDAQIQREQMAQQGTQFGQDLGLRRELGQGQIGLGQGDLALRGRLGDQQGNLGLLQLLTGNQQFGQDLSARLGMFGAGQDADMWKALLGGLQ